MERDPAQTTSVGSQHADDERAQVPERTPKCDHICLKDDGHVERGEPHFYGYELPSPRQAVDELSNLAPAYFRLLAEDDGTWADWARKLADALACVLNNPRGGYEQADNYVRAQGIGATVLAAYRVTHSDGDVCGQ